MQSFAEGFLGSFRRDLTIGATPKSKALHHVACYPTLLLSPKGTVLLEIMAPRTRDSTVQERRVPRTTDSAVKERRDLEWP